METLTPQDFLVFRSELGTASGFQSFQLREIELLLGLSNEERDKQGHSDPIDYLLKIVKETEFETNIKKRLLKLKTEPSLKDVLYEWLYRTPIMGSTPNKDEDENIISKFTNDYLHKIDEINRSQLKIMQKDGLDLSRMEKSFRETYNQFKNFLTNEDDHQMRRVKASILFIESYRTLPLLAWPRLLIDKIVELEEQIVEFGNYRLNLATREMSAEGKPLSLTSGEFAVLKSLVTHPREPLSRDKLMNLARGRDYSALERSIDVQVSRLRRMLEADPTNPRYIQTVWGLGYVFVPDGEAM